MNIEKYKALGVMSGTSLDGIDCAVIEFTKKNGQWYYQIVQGETITYPKEWMLKLQNAVNFPEADLHVLNIEYTYYLGELLNDFLKDNKLDDLNFIASHGHTVLHQPEHGMTLQIGNLPLLTDMFSIPFVCDFRVQDVLLCGQGAPLVPIGDRYLFADFDTCLNLGGFSNVSFEDGDVRKAFDICPINTLLNFYALKLGKSYDDGGSLAASGKVNQPLLDALNNLPFYQQQGPKSLGMEQVNAIYLPILMSYNLSEVDFLATLVEHMAMQIAKVLNAKQGRVLITGGGAYNMYLINRLKYYLSNVEVVLGAKDLIEFKEALIFAFLGLLRLKGVNNVLSSVTGAASDHCSGVIFNQEMLRSNC